LGKVWGCWSSGALAKAGALVRGPITRGFTTGGTINPAFPVAVADLRLTQGFPVLGCRLP
jgi:hypothetical protein